MHQYQHQTPYGWSKRQRSARRSEQPTTVRRDADTVVTKVVPLQCDRPPFVRTEYGSQDPLPATIITAFLALSPILPDAAPRRVARLS